MDNNKKLNILMIISDDQGYWSMGCAGNKEIITPNLDNLAQNGILFNNFFCVSPVCSPARASIFTGKIPSQHGVHDWISKGHIDEDQVCDDLRTKFYEDNISWEYEWSKSQLKNDRAIRYIEGQTCFTDILSQNGYKCGLSGKWHLGDAATNQAGFSYWKTIAMGGDNYYYPVVLENNKFVMKRDKYITDYITENALNFLDEQSESITPFYLSVHYTAPHAPWEKHHHPKEIYDLYNDCEFNSIPKEEPHPWSGVKYKNEEEAENTRRKNLQGYFTAITAMDRGIGQIIAKLKETNKLENTLIIFTSDNGMSMGHHGIYGKGNGTFPLNMYDTAVKVPMIIYNPNLNQRGIINDSLLSHYDILPTLLTYLGLENYIPKSLPGKSFAKSLENNGETENEAIVVFDEYGPTRMIRTKEWKYIHRYPYGPHELYNLKEDPDEKHNIFGTNNEITEKLRLSLNTWFNKYSIPETDGKGLAVKGIGQINLVSTKNEGKEPFIG